MDYKSIKFDWANWNIGGRIIFVSACVAALSMLMPWFDMGIGTRPGIFMWTILLLGLHLYPAFVVLKNTVLDKTIGLACSIAAVLATLYFIKSMSTEVFGSSVSFAGIGAKIFLLASIALIAGVVKYVGEFTYAPHDEETRVSTVRPTPLEPSTIRQPQRTETPAEKLKAALDAGVLSQEEYTAKRKELEVTKLKDALNAGVLNQEEYEAKVAALI